MQGPRRQHSRNREPGLVFLATTQLPHSTHLHTDTHTVHPPTHSYTDTHTHTATPPPQCPLALAPIHTGKAPGEETVTGAAKGRVGSERWSGTDVRPA